MRDRFPSLLLSSRHTTRAADGTETEHTQPLAELAQTKAENGGTLVTLPETAPIVGDTLRLQS